MKQSYADFRHAVKESLKRRLAVWELSDDKLEKYMEQEEQQIKGEYRHYSEGDIPDGMTPESFLKSCVEGVSMCLEYCY